MQYVQLQSINRERNLQNVFKHQISMGVLYSQICTSDLNGPLTSGVILFMLHEGLNTGLEMYGIWWNKYQLVLKKGWPVLHFNKTQYTSIKLKAFCMDHCTSAPVRRVKGQNLEFKFSFTYSMHSASWVDYRLLLLLPFLLSELGITIADWDATGRVLYLFPAGKWSTWWR